MGIKEELKQDEELLVKVFKLEKFINKYKKPIIIIVALIFLSIIGYKVYDYIQTQKIINSNNALNKALNNDKNALNELKKDKKLYNLYLLNKGKFSEIDLKELKAIKAYELAMQKGDKKSLENYLLNPEYKILKNPVRFALMRIYLKENNRQKAKILYDEIDSNSKFKQLGLYLLHYGIVK